MRLKMNVEEKYLNEKLFEGYGEEGDIIDDIIVEIDDIIAENNDLLERQMKDLKDRIQKSINKNIKGKKSPVLKGMLEDLRDDYMNTTEYGDLYKEIFNEIKWV